MFLSCGDALFDLFAGPSHDPAVIMLEGRAGGSPMNVAIGLSRLGAKSAYFTKISRDTFGERIMETLKREGVDIELIVRTEALSTLAIVALDVKGVPAYSFYTQATADISLEASDLPAALPHDIKVIHIASYSTAAEPVGSTLAGLVAREKNRRLISYDPNIRLAIEPDVDIWRARVKELSGSAHLMKASEEDVALLYGGRSPDSLAREWLSRGVKLCIITRGSDGATAVTAGGVEARVSGFKVVPVDTVGAGDTFQAATLDWLGRKGRLSPEALASLTLQDLTAMLTYAAKAAAITCSRRGADLPRAHELAEAFR
jgi:fructokinase